MSCHALCRLSGLSNISRNCYIAEKQSTISYSWLKTFQFVGNVTKYQAHKIGFFGIGIDHYQIFHPIDLESQLFARRREISIDRS